MDIKIRDGSSSSFIFKAYSGATIKFSSDRKSIFLEGNIDDINTSLSQLKLNIEGHSGILYADIVTDDGLNPKLYQDNSLAVADFEKRPIYFDIDKINELLSQTNLFESKNMENRYPIKSITGISNFLDTEYANRKDEILTIID